MKNPNVDFDQNIKNVNEAANETRRRLTQAMINMNKAVNTARSTARENRLWVANMARYTDEA